MNAKFFKAHFFFEFFGTAMFVFVNTMLGSSIDPNRAFTTSFVWGGIRWIRPSAMLDPLQTLVPELLILRYHLSLLGWFKIIGSIAMQIGGCIFGAYMSYLFQGSNEEFFSENLTAPPDGVSAPAYLLMLGDFIWVFPMGLVSYTYIWSLIKKYKDKQDKLAAESCGIEINGQPEDSDDVQLIPQIEAAATGSVLFLAIDSMYQTTKGSFIITRSLGPAIILNNYTFLGWYFLGQVAGQLLACLCVYFALFDHS